MKVQEEYDVDVLGTNHHSINWLSCIVHGPEKTEFHRYLTNNNAEKSEVLQTEIRIE